MWADHIPAGLERLDPERRALLELSFRRNVADDDIAELLNVSPAEVERRREEGVEELSHVLGLEPRDDREELAAGLRAMSQEKWAGPSREDPRPGKLVLAIAFTTAALAAAGLVLAALAGEDDGTSQRPAGSAARQPAPSAERSAAPRARLRPVAGGRGEGTVRLLDDGERLLISVRGLQPPGRNIYVVWLYRAVDDAVAIGGSRRSSFRLNARLPGNAGRYPAVDVSLEPRDANDSHAGDSVLRAPLGRLRAPG